MKASLPRTAAFSWSPANLASDEPLLATGTVAGALDESFSNDSLLELWAPSYGAAPAEQKPRGSAVASARFNRLAWGNVGAKTPMGLLAAGLDNGELAIWDAQAVLDGSADSQIMRNTTHTGPIKGLHFNPIQPNLLASGGVSGEVYIWDLTNPTKPYSPGARSQKLDEITAAAWNSQVAHILATSSASGYTVVWDLKNKREVTALSYGGGAATSGPAGMNGNGAGRRGVGAVCWHPDTPTRLVTASDDDASPIIMLWDLRNARAPEKILTGHDKGVLAMSWCKQDADLLLSCGKDNRTLCWNPQLGEVVGEVPSSSNWSFDVQWCPRNPAMLATSSFDGRIGIHSLQTTNAEAAADVPAAAPPADGSDIFNLPSATELPSSQGVSLRQAPKWLRRPVSAAFGFGGQLVSVANLPSAAGGAQSSVVHLRDVITEPSIVSRATRLQEALEADGLAAFCDERSRDSSTRADDVANWKALQTLFTTGSRDELVALLGFSKEDVAEKVATAINVFKRTSTTAGKGDLPAIAVQETAAEAPAEPTVPPTSEAAVSESTEATDGDDLSTGVSKLSTEDSEATEQSLFSDDAANTALPQSAAADADFFSSLGAEGPASAIPDHLQRGSALPGSSVAATAGSPGPSSVASEPQSRSTFRIYPSEEGEAERLITRAIVLGDFESAVSLCLSTDRFADALLLAVRGGPELLARTQKAYFERRTTSLPYLRLFQSIVSDDLTDVVQNADLTEWQEIFVVLCTFAKAEEFAGLAEQLGQRLEYQYTKSSRGEAQRELRKNAVLCYLAAGKLEKVAGMWIDEMREEESALQTGDASSAAADGSLYSAHAEALQTFMEKITVFQAAVKYVDVDLAAPTQDAEAAASGARTYKLASLYDRIHEYVTLLSEQGLVGPALKYASQTPSDYAPRSAEPSRSSATGLARERLVLADAARNNGRGAAAAAAASTSAAAALSNGAGSSTSYAPAPNAYAAPAANAYSASPYAAYPAAAAPVAAVDPYVAQNPYYTPAPPLQPQAQQQQQQAQPQQPQQSYGAYAPTNAYAPAQPMVSAPAPPSIGQLGQPPSVQLPQMTPAGGPSSAAPPPPPPKRSNDGWNDIPEALAAATRRTGSAAAQKAAPIMSPFPNSPAPAPGQYGQPPQPGAGLPPPPRGATPGGGPGRGAFSPPPGQGPYGRPPGQQQAPPPPRGPPQGPPPPRGASAAGMRGPPTGAYAPAPGQVNAPPPPMPGMGGPGQSNFPGQQPQQGMPPQGQQQQQSPPGPYGAPQQQQQQGPPPGMHNMHGHPSMQQGPPGARPPQGPGGTMMPPAGVPPRAHTPGAGAGAPARSSTPAKPATKYPAGDRSHIPDAQRPIANVLGATLARIKQAAPPAQKRMMEDAERRINVLLDHLNCGTVDARMIPLLLNLAQAMDARNQQAALGLHLQLASIASGELATAMPGIKLCITRMA